jgi:trans-aconitate methyltransferase
MIPTKWIDYKQANPNYKKFIHPSGNSPSAYNESGLYDAVEVYTTIPNLRKKTVLDYGCGDGRVLQHLITHADKIYGVDVVPEFIDAAASKGLPCFLLDDLNIDQLDVCYSQSVFIHLDDEDTLAALTYIYNKLAPGGFAYLQILIYDYHTTPRDFIDVRTWSPSTYTNLIQAIGFEPIVTYYNLGEFSYNNIGTNHNQFQILHKPIKP